MLSPPAELLHVPRLLRPVGRLPVWSQSPVAHHGAAPLLPSSQPPRRQAPALQPVSPGCGGWAESAQRRLAVLRHSRHGRTLRKRRAGEEEEEERGRGRGRGHRRSMHSRPENGRASVFIFLGTLHTRVCTSCDGVSACQCV